ncbi:unnamed protein product [Umbelopsis sp. WA50703]
MDDPITHFDNEIRRILNYHSSADVIDLESQLLSVLKATIFYIQKQERYRNDPRYLRIWLMYATYYHDPMHVYTFLARIRIGTNLSAFYETVADFLEQSDRCSEALTVLSVGVHLNAEPLKRLKQKRLVFQEKHGLVMGPKLSDELSACQRSESQNHLSHRKEGQPEFYEQTIRRYQLIMGAPAAYNRLEKGHEWWDIALSKAPPKKRVCLKCASDNQMSFEESRAKQICHQDQIFDLGQPAAKVDVLTTNQTKGKVKKLSGSEWSRSLLNETSTISSAHVDIDCDKQERIVRDLTSPMNSHHEIDQWSIQRSIPTKSLNKQPFVQTQTSIRHSVDEAIIMDDKFFERVVAGSKDLLYRDQQYINRSSEPMPLKSKFRLTHSSSKFQKFMLSLSPYSLSVTAFIAQGGNAKVFLATNLQGAVYGMKIESPPSAYEYCIIKRVHSVLGPAASLYVVQPASFHQYKDAGCLMMEYCSQGTLLNAVNVVHNAILEKTSPTGLDEGLSMFFTIRLLQAVIALHQNGFVHGDLKADNVMVSFRTANEDGTIGYSIPIYGGMDDAFWAMKQIKLIDFGKAIDTNLFSKGQTFVKCWKSNKNDDAPQVHANKEWDPWVLDYWGMAKTVHCLLFGQHMQITRVGMHYRICQRLKRWWDQNVWVKFFHILLNPGLHLPITNVLVELEDEFKTILIDREKKNRLANSILRLQQLL